MLPKKKQRGIKKKMPLITRFALRHWMFDVDAVAEPWMYNTHVQ
jgi:hypothetical protein